MKQLGKVLVQRRWLSPQALQRALDHQRLAGGHLSTCLLELGLLPEEMILRALAEQLGVPGVDRDSLRSIEPEVLDCIPRKMAIAGHLLAFQRSGPRLSVALRELGDLGVQDELAFVTSHRIMPHVALDVRLAEALSRYYEVPLDDRYRLLVERLEREPATRPMPVPRLTEAATEAGSGPAAPHRRPAPAAAERAAARLASTDQLVVPPFDGEIRIVEAEPQPATADPTQPLRELEQTLLATTERDDIGEALIDFLSGSFTRVLLVMLRGNEVDGWLGRGSGIDQSTLHDLSIPLDPPSIFLNLRQGAAFHLGPLADLPAHHSLAETWGGDLPKEAIALPIRIRNRLVAAIYADRGAEGCGSVDLALLQRAALKAGIAFEMFILRKKLLTA